MIRCEKYQRFEALLQDLPKILKRSFSLFQKGSHMDYRKSDSPFFSARLSKHYNKLSKTEKKVADFIKEHADLAMKASTKELAEYTATGSGTVIRFCQALGFAGLPELKESLKLENMIPKELKRSDADVSESIWTVKKKILSSYIETMQALSETENEESIMKAVDLLDGARNIVISGAGNSRTNAFLFHDNLHLMNKQCFFCMDPIDESFQIYQLTEQDVFVGFSYTGRFQATLMDFKHAKERGASTIAIVCAPGSPMDKYADVCIYTNPQQTQYFLGTQEALLSTFVIIQIICTALSARHENLPEYRADFDRWINDYRVNL